MTTMLKRHIALLLEGDPFFRDYWTSVGELRRRHFVKLTEEVEDIFCDDDDAAYLHHEHVTDLTRRYVSSVPNKDLDYGRRPKDWSDFVANEEAKEELSLAARGKLDEFLKSRLENGEVRLYGGVKPLSSLDAKLGETKTGWTARRRLRDTWDAVRFRIVTRDLPTLRAVGTEIWQYYLDEVIRCRNYYTVLKGGADFDPYRAIHFELEIQDHRWIEVQLLSEVRDLMGFFDFPFLFKKYLRFESPEHENWLHGLSARANIYDARAVPKGAVRSPQHYLV